MPRLGHRLADVAVHDIPTETFQDAAQVVERSAYVQIGNIDVKKVRNLRRIGWMGTALPRTGCAPRSPPFIPWRA